MACDSHAPHLSNPGCMTFRGGLFHIPLEGDSATRTCNSLWLRKISSDLHPAFADHRFIDPPPVVQFRAVETFPCSSARANDVTFDYNAQFFLLVTIEPLHRQATSN
ncbi:Developmental and secondary metabolism regulator veA [Penicillium lividum]|nr:Developmental and secondary metabolism regulator veA [Penicillium lividum]